MSAIPFGTTDWSRIEFTQPCPLRPGMSYPVADRGEAHRSYTELGARLFIVD